MTLLDFLSPVENIQKEISLGDRFPENFKIRALTSEKFAEIRKIATARGRMDDARFTAEVVVAGTVYPCFASSDLCQKCGTMLPHEVPQKVLLAGELQKLAGEILVLSGFDNKENEEEIKN